MARVDVKVVLLGQQSVGKSCLLDRYINGFFEGRPRNTIGAAFAAKKVTVQNGRVLSLGVWDTAGAERFQSISRMYYRGSKAAIVCFTPISQQSFTKALFWAKEVTDHEPDCRIYFAMTKCDLLEQLPSVGVEPLAEASPSDQADMAATPDSIPESESSEDAAPIRQQQEVLNSDIKTYAAFYQSKVFATSAKTGIGVKQLFTSIAEDLAGGAAEMQAPQIKHQHTVRPVSPHYLQSRGTGPSSPLGSSHNSTYSRTKRKYLPSCCC